MNIETSDQPERDDENDQCREVYAYFGLAMYWAQVFEHEIINSIMLLKIFPNSKSVKSLAEWQNIVDDFYAEKFEKTMGKIVADFKLSGIDTSTEFMQTLESSLNARNFLAHKFFRIHSIDFVTNQGRTRMIEELASYTELFKSANESLCAKASQIRFKLGMSDEMIAHKIKEMSTPGSSDQ